MLQTEDAAKNAPLTAAVEVKEDGESLVADKEVQVELNFDVR